MCRMIVFVAAKKWLKTAAIVLSLKTIESRISTFVPSVYPTSYCDFLQEPHLFLLVRRT